MIDFNDILASESKYNFHSHSQYCDGRDTMENIVKSAVQSGFKHLGFSPHSPIPIPSPCNMSSDNVQSYINEIERLKATYNDEISIYCSMEIDYLDDWNANNDYFQNLPLDYKISSVHFIPSFCNEGYVDVDGSFENFRIKMQKHFYNDIEGVIISFYTQTLNMIEAGGFDIIGHFDKIGFNANSFKPGVENEEWYKSLVREVFDAIMDNNYFIEINTKAFEAHNRFFPDYSFWNLLKKYDAPILFNTDVHFPHLVESGRQQAIELYNKL